MPIVPRSLVCLALLCVGLLLPSPARAGTPGDGFPIIQSGRESAIQALVAPFTLQKELAPGWTFATITISATSVRYIVRGPSGAEAALRLEHPDRAPSGEHTKSFTLFRDLTPSASGETPGGSVLDPLAAAVQKNDPGGFWPAAPAPPQASGSATLDGPLPTSLTVEEKPKRWELTLRRKLLLGGLVAALLLLVLDRRLGAQRR